MEKGVEFLLRALNKQQWFDQKQKNKFVEDPAHIILVDKREHTQEFRFLRKVINELGIRR